jgi:hypothetical protein
MIAAPSISYIYFRVSEEDDEDWSQTVIIRYFSDPTEAQLCASHLEQKGVPNFLANKFFTQMLPGVGGIALHVRVSDRAKALRILTELETSLYSERPVFQRNRDFWRKSAFWLVLILLLLVLLHYVWSRKLLIIL